MSPDWLAPALVMPAASTLVSACPGAMPPKTSCVTLPMPPIGLMSVSPVDRVAIIASTELITTAISVIHHGMPNTE